MGMGFEPLAVHPWPNQIWVPLGLYSAEMEGRSIIFDTFLKLLPSDESTQNFWNIAWHCFFISFFLNTFYVSPYSLIIINYLASFNFRKCFDDYQTFSYTKFCSLISIMGGSKVADIRHPHCMLSPAHHYQYVLKTWGDRSCWTFLSNRVLVLQTMIVIGVTSNKVTSNQYQKKQRNKQKTKTKNKKQNRNKTHTHTHTHTHTPTHIFIQIFHYEF